MKNVADTSTDFAPDLPLLLCLPGEMNQVFLNLIINAAHAIDEAAQGGMQGKGTIARNVVVDKHRGSLHCSSEPGRGTTFIIRLPLH